MIAPAPAFTLSDETTRPGRNHARTQPLDQREAFAAACRQVGRVISYTGSACMPMAGKPWPTYSESMATRHPARNSLTPPNAVNPQEKTP
jgi:hypothetical protein